MRYVYSMVQLPPTISVAEKSHQGHEAAQYLEKVVNAKAADGWEFYRVDTIGVQLQPGCLGTFMGRKAVQYAYYVATFRQPK